MNNALKDIATKYEISEEKMLEILAGMKVKNAEKPSKPQIEGFEKVCILLEEGKPMDEALATILDEAKNGKTREFQIDEENSQPTDTPKAEELDNFILRQAEYAADATLVSFPQIANEEQHRLKELFVQRYRQRIAQQLQDPKFRQHFQAAIEGQGVGKLNLLSSTTSNIALPSSSSSSNSSSL